MGISVFGLLSVCVIQYCIINGLEKMIIHHFVKDGQALRPQSACTEEVTPTNCLGMPSGHAEIGTMVALFLYSRNYVSLPTAALLAAAVCLERVFSNHHTAVQTAAGVLFGFVYFLLYSEQSWFVLIVFFLYVNVLLFLVERSFTVPAWIKKETIELVEKKRTLPYHIKLINVAGSALQQTRPLVITWAEVEAALDKIIASLDEPPDAIVGIKTGGAILADYLQSKLNVPAFKVKVSEQRNKCKKRNTLYFYLRTLVLDMKPKYMMCEEVEKIEGTVLLIDECAASGGQIELVTKHLYEKGAKTVYRAVISSAPSTKNIYSVMKRELTPAVWPWGYDN